MIPWKRLTNALGLTLSLLSIRAVADEASATFFMGRLQYARNQGVDCQDVGRDLVELVSRVSTVRLKEEKRVHLTDPELFESPFLFVNGHDDFRLSAEELESLRTYLEHGGFLLASGCCTNPAFPAAMRRELGRLFPGASVVPLGYDHAVYKTFYEIDGVKTIDRGETIYVEALEYGGVVVAALVEEGLCCAFSANNTCNRGRGIRPEDGQRLAVNIAVYAMTH